MYVLQKVTVKVADFRKISAGIFPHSEGRLPPCSIAVGSCAVLSEFVVCMLTQYNQYMHVQTSQIVYTPY